MKDEQSEYRFNSRFWTGRTAWSVMGDFLGRIPALALLNAKRNEVVVDAGSGEGFLTRKIAESGARVFGVDRSPEMYQKAVERERMEGSLGITYRVGDIAVYLPFTDEFADAVFCCAVLIHDSPEECESFFKEANRILKPGGRMVLSIMHPALFQPGSPNRTGRASWAQYQPLEKKCMNRSQRFREYYRDKDGNTFDSVVWYHPENCFPELLQKTGFRVVRRQDNYVTPEALRDCNQTGEVGYPAFYQLLAVKG